MREPDFVDECYADKDLSLLKKLTLVIPTYNRNYYLSRCLWYHAHFPFGEIIVADSSPEEKKVVNRETVAKVREMFGANVRYLEYEPETEKYGGDIYRKWGDAVQHVETEYSQIVTDKEFEIPITQCRCIKFLNEHNDYCVADGINYVITKDHNNKLLYSLRQCRGSLTVDDPIERMYLSVTNSVYPLLGLYRADVQKSIYSTKYQIDDIRFGEAILNLLAMIFGKYIRFSDCAITCRDTIRTLDKWRINKSESSTLRYPQFREYPEQYSKQKYYELRYCIYNSLLDKSTDIPEVISEKIDEFLPQYLRHIFPLQSRVNSLYYTPIIKYIWDRVPCETKMRIRKLLSIQETGIISNNIDTNNECFKIINNILS